MTLNKTADASLYEQLYIGIKQAIVRGEILPETKLPSKRQLAEFLSISQTTVELAYGQLLDEGYISSKPRIGFFVEDIAELAYVSQPEQPMASQPASPLIQYDFSPGKIDEEAFPFKIWRKIAKDVYDDSYKHLLQTGHRQGEFALRQEIAQYLYASRGIVCSAEQIVIGSGTEQLLPMILNLFENNAQLAVENPGYSPLTSRQAIPIPVDEDGLMVEALAQTEANIVYITPSHQFPTGAVLSAARRVQLLSWANAKPERYIIEDDYDSEFRYKGKPIPALQGMDRHDKVIYLSTFTKSLMPSLRVAYFVLPKSLLHVYKERLTFYSSTVPRFDQQILTRFMQEGHFAKHLNRMRKIYRKKHDKIVSLLEQYPAIHVSGDVAGMHILISVDTNCTEQQLLKKAEAAHIRIYPLSNYMYETTHFAQPTFLIGFGGIPFQELEIAIAQLLQVLLPK